MSSSERNIVTEQDFTNLVPVEGYPGLFTYKDVDIPDKEEMDKILTKILADREMEKLREEVKKGAEEIDLSGMKLVPLEDHPGLFTYELINSE